MTNPRKVEAIEYDATTEVTAFEHFPTVEAAIRWCEERKGQKMIELDTEFGFQLMTEQDVDKLSTTSEWPAQWYEVHGAEEDGQIRYLEDGDYEEAQNPNKVMHE